MEWMLMPYRRYAEFSGRSCRKEYWMFHLFWWLVIMALVMTMFVLGNVSERSGAGGVNILGGLLGVLIAVFFLGSLIPMIAVTVRRFHDQEKSGWMYMLGFIPYVGGLIVFVFMCIEGTRGPNRFGDDLLDPSHADVFA